MNIMARMNTNSTKTIIIIGGSQGAEIFGKIIPKVILDLSKNYKINIIQQSLPRQVNEIKNFYNKNNIENNPDRMINRTIFLLFLYLINTIVK